MLSSTLCASRPRRVGLALAMESAMTSFASGDSLALPAGSAGSAAAALVGVAGAGLASGDGASSGDGLDAAGLGLGDTRCAKAPARAQQQQPGQQLPVQLSRSLLLPDAGVEPQSVSEAAHQ